VAGSAAPQQPLGSHEIAGLIRIARNAHARGSGERARALLHTLAQRAPDEREVWWAIADVAADPRERLRALERIVEIDRRAIVPVAHHTMSDVPPPVDRGHTVIMITVAVVVAIVLAGLTFAWYGGGLDRVIGGAWRSGIASAVAPAWPTALVRGMERAPAISADATPRISAKSVALATLPSVTQVVVQQAATTPVRQPSLPTAQVPLDQRMLPGVIVVPPPTQLMPTPSVVSGTAVPHHQPGVVYSTGQWQLSVLRASDVVWFDGAIDGRDARGRYAVALVIIINNGDASIVPGTLFSAIDAQGRRYRAEVGLSRAYLDAFGRGVRGDISLAEVIPGAGVSVSVPVVFDVPADAGGVRVVIGDDDAGWQVLAPQRSS
jgi:hypothetical protein